MQRREPRWLTRVAIDASHAELIRTHGGSHGLRDANLLESAIARQQRWTYDTAADLLDLAAAYGMGLAKNHAYVDGNKRIAFQAMYAFLRLNGARLQAPEPEVVTLMLDVATGALDEAGLAAWLRDHVKLKARR